jgi:hypothetical protein
MLADREEMILMFLEIPTETRAEGKIGDFYGNLFEFSQKVGMFVELMA